jgi:hypothetical protein
MNAWILPMGPLDIFFPIFLRAIFKHFRKPGKDPKKKIVDLLRYHLLHRSLK